jgi:hypothetical protein
MSKVPIDDLHSALPQRLDPRSKHFMTVPAHGENGNHRRHAEAETDRSRQS